MARLNYSGVAVTGGTGRLNSGLGGSVLMKNGVVRNYITPNNPQSSGQMATRAAFANINSGWSVLTEADRLAWESAASSGTWDVQDTFSGTSRKLTGKTLYLQCNMNIYEALGELSNISTPAAKIAAPDAALTGGTSVAGVSMTITMSTAMNLGWVAVPKMTPAQSSGTMKARDAALRVVGRYGAAATGTLNVFADYSSRFGGVLAGQKVFAKVKFIHPDTGQSIEAGSVGIIST